MLNNTSYKESKRHFFNYKEKLHRAERRKRNYIRVERRRRRSYNERRVVNVFYSWKILVLINNLCKQSKRGFFFLKLQREATKSGEKGSYIEWREAT